MAYFSNGSEGGCFDEQCAKCKYGNHACPIAWVQTEFNYKSVNNETATAILDSLISNNGTCSIYEMAKSDFAIDPSQLSLLLTD